jgi:hypothetical protein
MTITDFSNIIESNAPIGWGYYAAGERAQYNTNKTVSDVMLCILPNPWPSQWRNVCKRSVTFSLWFGKVVPVKRTTTGTQQHDPYSPLELRAELIALAQIVIAGLSNESNLSITNDPVVTFYDAPEGGSVNSQAWLEVPIEAIVWQMESDEDYLIDNEGNYLIEGTNYLTK